MTALLATSTALWLVRLWVAGLALFALAVVVAAAVSRPNPSARRRVPPRLRSLHQTTWARFLVASDALRSPFAASSTTLPRG